MQVFRDLLTSVTIKLQLFYEVNHKGSKNRNLK